jgi:anti-sigma factor RsiW
MTRELNCRDTIQLLMDYVEGVLSLEDRAAIDAHCRACPRCLEFIESYRATPRLLREATASEMPAELKDRLRKFLTEKKRQS